MNRQTFDINLPTAAVFLGALRWRSDLVPQLLKFWKAHGGTYTVFWELNRIGSLDAVELLSNYIGLDVNKLEQLYYRLMYLGECLGPLVETIITKGNISLNKINAEIVAARIQIL
jgi:hypothetical protein